MTKYTIVTDEVQRVLNDISDQAFRLRTDYQHIADDIQVLRENVCGWTERMDQTASGQDLDSAISHFYDSELNPFFDDLAADLGRLGLAMQDVLNHYVSGDAEKAWRSNIAWGGASIELTTSGHGDPPPEFDTRDMTDGVSLGDDPTKDFEDAYLNHEKFTR